MRIPTYTTAKEKQMFRDEYAAYEENRCYDIRKSISDRTMTKRAYLAFHHGLRLFIRDMQGNKFFAGAYF